MVAEHFPEEARNALAMTWHSTALGQPCATGSEPGLRVRMTGERAATVAIEDVQVAGAELRSTATSLMQILRSHRWASEPVACLEPDVPVLYQNTQLYSCRMRCLEATGAGLRPQLLQTQLSR